MKKTILLLSLICAFAVSGKAQTPVAEHSIKVYGTAEMEIIPDEIYMSVTLKEYTKDKKKFTIEELEKNFVHFIEKTTVTDKKDIKMDDMNASLLTMKRKNKDEVITKSYNVKFKNAQQVYLLYSAMDSLGISKADISRYSHSKMEEYKKQIKINAIQAAKEKAQYLLLAIGEKAGKALMISESSGYVTIDDGTRDDRNTSSFYRSRYSQSNSLDESEDLAGTIDTGIGDKTIKLSYSIEARFEIL